MTLRQQFINILTRNIQLKMYREYTFEQRMNMTRTHFYKEFNYHLLNEMSECNRVRNNDALWHWYLNVSDKQWKRVALEARRNAWKGLY